MSNFWYHSGLAAYQPLLLALPVFFFFVLAFIVLLLFAFGEADFEFDAPARVVQVDRYQRIAGAYHAADESFDFLGMQQQLARARGVGVHVRGGCKQRADMRADQVQGVALHNHVRLFQLRAARTDGFDFPAFKHHAGLETLFDEIVVEGFFVFNDTHRPILPVRPRN